MFVFIPPQKEAIKMSFFNYILWYVNLYICTLIDYTR